MEKLTDDQWLLRLPHHIEVSGEAIDASEWCLENLHPREWHHRISISQRMQGFTLVKTQREVFAFREKKHALMFKLMWWNI